MLRSSKPQRSLLSVHISTLRSEPYALAQAPTTDSRISTAKLAHFGPLDLGSTSRVCEQGSRGEAFLPLSTKPPVGGKTKSSATKTQRLTHEIPEPKTKIPVHHRKSLRKTTRLRSPAVHPSGRPASGPQPNAAGSGHLPPRGRPGARAPEAPGGETVKENRQLHGVVTQIRGPPPKKKDWRPHPGLFPPQ